MMRSWSLLFPFLGFSTRVRWALALSPTFLIFYFRPFLPAIASQTPAAFHYPVVFLASWIGGFIPGFLSTLACSIYTLFFIRPHLLRAPFTDTPGLTRTAMFFLTSMLFILLISAFQRTLRKAYENLKTRDHFLSLASHELKTPLMVLKLQLGLVKRRSIVLSNEFSVLDRHVDRLERLINSMFDLSLIESEQFKIIPEECDLCSIVEETISALRLYGEAKNSFITFVNNGPLIGQWDRMKVGQVITNILHNAIKYGNGQPISVKTGSEGDNIWIKISDQGSGISKMDIEKIFLPYQRLENAKVLEGLGIGLYLSKKIVELHSGEISVESDGNRGTCFLVSLPKHV